MGKAIQLEIAYDSDKVCKTCKHFKKGICGLIPKIYYLVNTSDITCENWTKKETAN